MVLTILEGATFCVCNDHGDIAEPTAGFFAFDTRYLSVLRLSIDDRPLRYLDTRQIEYFSALFFLRNGVGGDLGPDELLVRRERFVGDHLHERIVVQNVCREPRSCELAIELASDFADVLAVKSHDIVHGHPAHVAPLPDPVRPVPGEAGPGTLVIRAPEGDVATTIVATRPLSHIGDDGLVRFAIELPPQGQWTIELTVYACDGSQPGVLEPAAHWFGQERRHVEAALRTWRMSVPSITSASPDLAGSFGRSITDLAALRMRVGTGRVGRLPAAGVPWFMTIFGRDTLITCLETLILGQDLARTALEALADLQATTDDPSIDAEPGKIVHEVRRGRGARAWFPRYYGSVDATPLYLILLSEVWRWTGDDELVRELREPALAALRWIDEHGDRNGDGFVDYERRAPNGLVNQSWKDSWDSQLFASGRLAATPIAPVEVQGYVYDAKLRLAEMAVAVWRDRDLAARLEHEAVVLQRAFDHAYWLPDRGHYALALDGEGRPVDSLCSNIGHLLWSGIVPEERVDAVVGALLGDALWSGWGVRTMSRDDHGYGPLTYHNGTVWPHDNAIIAWGLARYGRHEAARRIARALLDASAAFDHVLPEVFTGLPRTETPFPVPYPTANRPQAWSAAAPVLLVRVLLGLEPDRERSTLVARIAGEVPSWLEGTRVAGIPALGARFDVTVVDGAVRVERCRA